MVDGTDVMESSKLFLLLLFVDATASLPVNYFLHGGKLLPFKDVIENIDDDTVKTNLVSRLETLANETQALQTKLIIANIRAEEANKRADRAEAMAGNLRENVGREKSEKGQLGKLMRALAVRSRMETLADEFWMDDLRRPWGVSVRAAFQKILQSNEKVYLDNQRVMFFRQIFAESGLTVQEFLDTCETLYGMISDEVAHKLGPFIDVPKWDDIAALEEVLATANMKADPAKVRTLQIFLKPLPLVSAQSTTRLPIVLT